jgi:hypothetical protein
VIEYIERVARRLPGGEATPRTICLLQSEPIINTNTFVYLSVAREDPYSPMDVRVGEPGRPGLEEWLKSCDFALYVKQPRKPVGESRLTLVNESFAANHMTPRLFRLFRGPTRTFPAGSPETSVGESNYLHYGGRPEWVRVLVRAPVAQ